MNRKIYRRICRNTIEKRVENELEKMKRRNRYGKKNYPSQRRYMDENPAITFRMKKEEKKRKVEMAELAGKSISDLVRVALLGLEEDFSEVYEKVRSGGYNHGFRNAKRAYRIWNFCNIYGKATDILPNSDAHKAIIDYLKKEGWGHPECHKTIDNTQL